MDYSLYVYGGGEILWKVFNGIALLFKSDNPYFTSLGKLTMGIGLLYVAARAIPRASFPIFFRSWFLPTLLLVTLFFGPKASVHIIDKVDSDFQYSKVDNIPVGIAAVASMSTHLATYLSEAVESAFECSDAERFSKVGPMFGAKLIYAAHQLTIKDPLMRQNLKDFTYQCFAWPYIFSNLEPGSRAALESEDMVGFVETNAHPMLGVYWREPDGRSTFVNCRECARRVREVIPIEVETGLQSLASKLFNTKQDLTKATRRLQHYSGEAWQKIANTTSSFANLIQQELMLNTYRQSLEDKRDEKQLGRSNFELTQLNAARGQSFQNESFLIKAALAGTNIPTLHSIFMAIALIYFTIMAPMTFLPGGMSWVATWVKVMIWLASWPVLFSVLNCLGYMFAGQAARSALIGYGDGLNVLTQNGLADAAYTAYCWVMGLQYSVPFVSWALISKAGGYAFSQLSSSLTQTGESFASKAGQESVDGNVSFDTQSLHNKSVANTQMAQQQLGGSFNYGSRFDDGKLATLHGPNGSLVAQEHQHSFSTNLSQNDSFSKMAAWQSQEMQNAAHQEGVNMQKSVSLGTQELASFAKSVADNKGTQENFGTAESANLHKQMQDLRAISDKYAADNQINKQVAFDAMVGAGLGKMFGLSANANFKTGSLDNEMVTKAQNSEAGKQFSEGLQHAINYALDNKASIGKTFNTQSLDQAQAHFNKAQVHSDSMSAHLSRSQSLSEMASRSRQSGISSTSNTNEAMVERVAQQFGGDKLAAIQYLAAHPEAAQQESGSLISSTAQPLSSSRGEQQKLQELYQADKHKMGPAPTRNADLDAMRASHNLAQQEKDLDTQIAEKRGATKTELGTAQGQTWKRKSQMAAQHTFADQTYEREKDKSLVGKSMEKVATNIGESTTIKTISNTVQSLIGPDKGKK
ncbi:conjugal transfer protein TraG N-terminal domain-containing protein [Candidatus Odyssella thessalonicensis]|uniref:conjugal transfer protein TraG N-terminal domain-containing protein n=1 Tax=Candidatus Odyssella thessalonicensis TaxID=84647 RepID=UPI000225A9DA|nr:conjugal transfer protein TraG N-terminal domain-containing protein [Candidatus Odyssella thessalonicensis]